MKLKAIFRPFQTPAIAGTVLFGSIVLSAILTLTDPNSVRSHFGIKTSRPPAGSEIASAKTQLNQTNGISSTVNAESQYSVSQK